MSGFFQWLPKVEKCCFFIANLKLACYIIITVILLSSIFNAAYLWHPLYCGQQLTGPRFVLDVVHILRWIFFGIEIAVTVSAIVFIIGILQSMPVLADIFTGCLLLKAVICIIYYIILVFLSYYWRCKFFFLFYSLGALLFGYFAIVVNSYRNEMD